MSELIFVLIFFILQYWYVTELPGAVLCNLWEGKCWLFVIF